ncbi:transporter permease protein [Cyclospora cayetanensis]|uniref:Transporter permease protein n=1 Tax=Cyclospora cayetanensis TaxID=88456 RepID=A0A1D3D4R2_9EIME|nr:transporter permease protein [Cyclospora cayetanensis]
MGAVRNKKLARAVQQNKHDDELLVPTTDTTEVQQRANIRNDAKGRTEDFKLAASICLFLIGYCGQPILVDYCRFQGVASVPGLVLCGSGVYILLSSTSIVWTAVLSALILGRSYTALQYFSLSLIVVGVSIKASNLTASFTNEEALGMLLSLLAAVLVRRCYPSLVPGTSGSGCDYSACLRRFCSVYPQNNQLLAPIALDVRMDAAPAHSGASIRVCYDAACWWSFVFLPSGNTGAVTSGALKGCKAAAVVVLSHVLFCSAQETQCVDLRKGIAAVVCITGVVLHSLL